VARRADRRGPRRRGRPGHPPPRQLPPTHYTLPTHTHTQCLPRTLSPPHTTHPTACPTRAHTLGSCGHSPVRDAGHYLPWTDSWFCRHSGGSHWPEPAWAGLTHVPLLLGVIPAVLGPHISLVGIATFTGYAAQAWLPYTCFGLTHTPSPHTHTHLWTTFPSTPIHTTPLLHTHTPHMPSPTFPTSQAFPSPAHFPHPTLPHSHSPHSVRPATPWDRTEDRHTTATLTSHTPSPPSPDCPSPTHTLSQPPPPLPVTYHSALALRFAARTLRAYAPAIALRTHCAGTLFRSAYAHIRLQHHPAPRTAPGSPHCWRLRAFVLRSYATRSRSRLRFGTRVLLRHAHRCHAQHLYRRRAPSTCGKRCVRYTYLSSPPHTAPHPAALPSRIRAHLCLPGHAYLHATDAGFTHTTRAWIRTAPRFGRRTHLGFCSSHTVGLGFLALFAWDTHTTCFSPDFPTHPHPWTLGRFPTPTPPTHSPPF